MLTFAIVHGYTYSNYMSLNLQLQPSVMVHCRSLVSIKAERERESGPLVTGGVELQGLVEFLGSKVTSTQYKL